MRKLALKCKQLEKCGYGENVWSPNPEVMCVIQRSALLHMF